MEKAEKQKRVKLQGLLLALKRVGFLEDRLEIASPIFIVIIKFNNLLN